VTWWMRLFRRQRLEAELEAELRDHVDRQVADLVAGGVPEAEARRRAQMSIGGVEQVKERCRDARGTLWLEQLAQDVRYGIRVLAKSPGFTAVAILSLALGIGANTAIFSLVDRLLLRTLPVREPHQLVLLDRGSWTNPIWEQIRDRQKELFQGAFAWGDGPFDLASGGQVAAVDGFWASGGFFNVLGVRPILGRTFTPEDDRRGGGRDGPVAVISYRFWQRHFGGTGDVVGRPLTLNRVSFTVIGVTEPDFVGLVAGRSFDVAVPLGTEPLIRGTDSSLDGRSTWWLAIMARLKPGQSVEDANRLLAAAQPQIREATLPDWPPNHLKRYLRDPLRVIPASAGPSSYRTQYRDPLLIIMVAVALVLLIACANIANLQLARANHRQHELSLRLALGGSRFRLARQLITESLLLSFAGGALGLLLARWASEGLVRQLSTYRETMVLDVSPDWRILAFTAVIAIATALLFGTAPAIRAGSVDPMEAIDAHGRGAGSMRRQMLSSPLIVMQVAVSLVLIVGAGLFVQTFRTLAHLDLGFDRDPVLLVNLDAQPTAIPQEQRHALFERARASVAALPGVERAALSLITPVSGMGWNQAIDVVGEPQLSEQDRMAWFNAVSPGWFATYGTTLLAGRDFDGRDRTGAPDVAIVNQAFARRFIKGDSAIGRVINRERFGGNQQEPPLTIIGVVEDAAYSSIREPVPPGVYVPLAQYEDQVWPMAAISVRAATGTRPELLIRSIAASLAAVDRNLSVMFLPLAEQVAADLVRERVLALLSGLFGALALLLAAIGLYGVTAYAVSRRRLEIGIRMALGAHAPAVMRLVLGRAATLVGLGLVVGVVLSFWASRLVGTLLYGLEPRDMTTLVVAVAVLATVGTLAAWLPARRAAQIDPAQVLREG
jgi:putative ABC transport system permease protein